jgi:ribosomal protein S18/ribosomal protein S6
MTRQYEAVYIFDSALDEAAIIQRMDQFHTLLGLAEPPGLDHWGKRTLAYPVHKHETGYYVIARFETNPEALPEYERAVKLDESVLRFLVVANEGPSQEDSGQRRGQYSPSSSRRRGRHGGGQGQRVGGEPRMRRRQKTCTICESGMRVIDYKDNRTLSRFLTERGKILPSRLSGTCARHQRQLGTAIKRARELALLPYIKGHSG